MSILEVPGARLYYEIHGRGLLRIMIPGRAARRPIPKGSRPPAAHYTDLIYDRRGFSRSRPDAAGPYGGLNAAIAELVAGPVHAQLVGHPRASAAAESPIGDPGGRESWLCGWDSRHRGSPWPEECAGLPRCGLRRERALGPVAVAAAEIRRYCPAVAES